MDLHLEGRRVLVTGASKGIGLACARRFAAEGCAVHLVARTREALVRACEDLRAEGASAVDYTVCDLADSAQLQALALAHGETDILINNAGAIPAGSLLDVDEARWRASWELKVFGYINLCRHLYAAMSGRGGVIVNIIGAGGERPSAAYAAGAGGNAALMALTRALGGESLRDGVRVVGINPGQILTDRLQTLLEAAANRKFADATRWREMIDARYPPGQPEQIADAAAFLASDRSAFTTGTIVTIDGGHCSR